MLRRSDQPLAQAYDLVMFDLDGVVYIGDLAVPGAPAHLTRLRELGVTLAFITNNASRAPGTVAEKLTGLGIEASANDVVTSAQAAARVLLDRFGEGSPVAVLGADGLEAALAEVGLVPVGVSAENAVALVSGYGPDVPWREVMVAAVRVRDGLPWVASNTDLTLPTATGTAPGHGVLVDMLCRYSGVVPVVAGKPRPPLLLETVRRVGGKRPLMIGDRLDTDILGGQEAGIDSLLVLTGVTGLPELVAATPHERPTYLAPDLSGLFEPHRPPTPTPGGGWTLGGWSSSSDGVLRVTGDGTTADWWRVLAAAAWQHLDDTGEPVDTTGLVPPGESGAG